MNCAVRRIVKGIRIMKKLFSLILAVIMLAPALAVLPVSADTEFSDVAPDMWSFDSISYAVEDSIPKVR